MKNIIVQIILSVIVFLIILYKGYRFEINSSSIPFILTYIVMLIGYIFFNLSNHTFDFSELEKLFLNSFDKLIVAIPILSSIAPISIKCLVLALPSFIVDNYFL